MMFSTRATPDSRILATESRLLDGRGFARMRVKLLGMFVVTYSVLLGLMVPIAAGAESSTIGVIGCSNTNQHVLAYHALSVDPQLVELPKGAYAGGEAKAWLNKRGQRKYWPIYDSLRPVDGYGSVWIQLCMRADSSGLVFDQEEIDVVTSLIAKVRERDPQAVILISPLNFYTTESCASVGGIVGQQVTVDTAAWAVANLGVQPGPDTGPLGPEHLATDGCHLNRRAGYDLVGGQMVAWFDGG